MNSSVFSITYPPVHPGTEKSDILFFSGTPDICAVFPEQGKDACRRLFVTDTVVSSLPAMQPFISRFKHGENGKDVLVVLEAGESFKTFQSVLAIVKTALDHNFTRRDIFTGIGGGVICDMTAFAASIFKRGAAAEFVPTTLLAMVDAAVGGKTGCDFDDYKNMIGAFFPARTLYVFPQFVQSLPADQYRSGLAEAVKTALLYAEPLYALIEKNKKEILSRDGKLIDQIITFCVKAKASVVEQDFTEQGIRMQLNFGHTFGHALETVAGLGTISHGDAVAWGISRALALSERLRLCTPAYRSSVCSTLASFGWDTCPIPQILAAIPDASGKLLDAMKKDKKNSGSSIRVILQKGITQNIITEAADSDIHAVLTA